MSTFVKNLLIEQRRRLVGSVMQHIESKVYPRLPQHEREALREKVITSVGAYHDVCLDLLKASVSDGTITNETALEAIGELHASVNQLRRDLAPKQ